MASSVTGNDSYLILSRGQGRDSSRWDGGGWWMVESWRTPRHGGHVTAVRPWRPRKQCPNSRLPAGADRHSLQTTFCKHAEATLIPAQLWYAVDKATGGLG